MANKKRKLTSPAVAEAPAEAPAEEPKEGKSQEEENQPPTEANSELPIDENFHPDAPSTDLGEAAAEAENGVDEDEDENDRDPNTIQQLLEPFTKDHLIELLRDAAVKHPDVLAEIHRIVDCDPVHRKVFVHGLGWDTNAEVLTAAFRQYGEIEDCNAVIDRATGKSKGYGFILFKHRAGARRSLQEPQKKIGNRITSCQLASIGPVPPPAPPVSEYTQRKIFVSNVGAELDPQKLVQFFSKYGEIEEGPLGLDKVSGKPKGFALFVYKTVESAKKALEEPHKNFEGHILHCQKAIDGPKPNKPGFHFQSPVAHHIGLHHVAGGIHGAHIPRNHNPSLFGGVGSHLSSATSAGHLMAPSGAGHLMAPSGAGVGFNPDAQPAAAVAAGLNPVLGQALTALLANQGSGLGLTNILGNLGSGGVAGTPGALSNSSAHGLLGGGYGGGGAVGNLNAGMMGGHNSQAYGQGGYGTPSTGQGGAGRSQTGLGQMGNLGHYIGH
ncbi:RNA-binding protein P-like [Zingiber officinale]|uniref:RNA-binding protein P-like n=1 Tax=Zingiber officinale TaxID=94328 RepID=UPI001C4C3B7D|nr:RNA-binding protein P-like [Zingiber officinale]XP_042470416.1 RNA-binding protein P-like [Zingiber officinale]XP_042470417.1 RNA-binding protein P-like [Zingiber officinale]XP_042470418.1 RNA-binding protein P-like [Zingiber officinale]XP_042470419.1 RNA-binding protein P-like [Zingiber officinale]XP_042470420.1 RNA-binding protein P-like [Zingiber officinale]